MWRYGVLYRSCTLIELLDDNPQTESEILRSFQAETYRNVRVEDLLGVLRFASWVVDGEDDRLVATDEGREMLAAGSDMLRMRRQVEKLIELMKPDWAASAVQGRQAMLNYVDANVRQCFKEAGLAERHDADVVEWWDRLAAEYRGAGSYQYTEIGRRGERLSCEREFSRTGIWPVWIALEHAEAGYDLVSRVSQGDDTSLVIEVKTTTQDWASAVFFVSRHEWDVLCGQPYALVHLWCVRGTPPKLATVTLEQLEHHVPQDTGQGKWKKFCCPFGEFQPIH